MKGIKYNQKQKKRHYIEVGNSIDCHVSPTYRADIYVGFREGYTGAEPTFAMQMAQKVLQHYCDTVCFAVTLESTFFIYKDGCEHGVKVGLINYPRYPKTDKEIQDHALSIAKRLKDEFRQFRVSVVCTDETFMIGELE